MKSIVLCERTLVQESGEFDLKEEKINEEEGNEEEKIFNGGPDSKKSENHEDIPEKYEVTFQNGGNTSSELLVKAEIGSETDEKKPRSPMASTNKTIESGCETNISLEIAKNSSCDFKSGTDSSVNENIPSESEIFKISGAQKDSHAEDRKERMDILDRIDVVGDNAIQIIESETSLHNANNGFLKQNCENKVIKEEDIEQKGNIQPLEDVVIYLDENKENEKEETASRVENCSDDLLTKQSNECEIQVGEVQTISCLEKDSMWAENDLIKSEEDLKENSEENFVNDCNEGNMNTIEGEKEEGQELDGDDNVAEESIEGGMHLEVEVEQTEDTKIAEVEQTKDTKVYDKEREVTDLDTFSAKKSGRDEIDKVDYQKSENMVCRKRQMLVGKEENSTFKKRKLSKDEEDADQMLFEEEKTKDSSLCESLDILDISSSPTKGQLSPEARTITTKRTSTDDKDPKKFKNSETSEENKIKNHQTAETVFSVLEKFRGSLKTLTRSDLEELIVQKLCEVITERSNVGELRRKAQALEQEQERWKAKAQSLTKQMREMEMVMRKYISEVHKQIKEGDNQVVTPLKVTRSVGLQVSFYSSTNKSPKANLPQSVPSNVPQNVNARNGKGPPVKSPSQFSPVTQNAKNKPTPIFQKGPPSLQKSPVNQQRRPIVPKPDCSANPSNRSAVIQQSLLNNNRGAPNQVQASRPNYKPAPGTSSSQQHQQQQQLPHHQSPPQQQQQQQQQNGSKVIDLTEDDDRQTGNTAKTSGPVRVINHLTQPPSSQNNRFAYLLPTTSTSTGSPIGQGRQVLIATPTMPQPNRQIMCSMPPLLFKGSSPVQSSSQPQMLNQSNKVILPKALRHPAPLPQRPIYQCANKTIKLPPPKPALKISRVQTGIVLSWNMSLGPEHAPISSYQLYAYQESDSPPATSLWKKVGDVKALPLPMACTLTQFMTGHKYHFAVRAVDYFSRIGPFSFPGTIVLLE